MLYILPLLLMPLLQSRSVCPRVQPIAGYRRPMPPSIDLIAVATGSHKITLFWDRFPGATEYSIYRSSDLKGPYHRVATHVRTRDHHPGVVNKFMYSDSPLKLGVDYYFIVKAVRHHKEVAYSNADDTAPDKYAIPWDTGNAAKINATLRRNLSNAFDPDIDPKTGKKVPADVGVMTGQGPDGAVYFSLPPKNVKK